MHSVCVVELHVAVSYIKILSVAQQHFYGKFMSPEPIKHTCVFIQSAQRCIKTKDYLFSHGLLLSFVACLAVPHFSTLSHKRQIL
jgi:hypothetical protein